jgi:hydrogenase maturation protease
MSCLPGHEGALIVGFGNSLRGDDAAGLLAAGRLAGCGFDAVAVCQLTPELAQRIAAARRVVFLDAHAGMAAGEVAVERIEPAEGAPGALEHFAAPARLLRLARDAYGAAPEAWLVSMGGRDFGLGERLSPEAKQAVRQAVKWGRLLACGGLSVRPSAQSALASEARLERPLCA